jgi:4-hydroxybenzoate polyprenyltransferase
LGIAVFAGASLFIHVMAITMLSKKEVGSEKPSSVPFYIVFAVIGSVAGLGLLLHLQLSFLPNLAIFAAVMAVTFKRHILTGTPSVQKAIRNMVLSIIILDSVFVSGTAGLPYGLATMLLIAPAVVLAKKLYVT